MAKQDQKRSVQKVLRIGVFQNKNCLEERLVHSRKPVTVGQDFTKNTFVIPASELPKSMTVFDVSKDGKYILNFTGKMSGRVALGDSKPMKLKDLVSSGKATKTAEGYSVQLDERTYGRVAFVSGGEEVALLFQFVKPPPPRARPVLPASMRGGLVYGILGATTLAITCSISAIFQVGFVAFLLSRDWPKPRDMDYQLPDRFVSILVDEEEPEPIEVDPIEEESDPDGEGDAQPEEESDSDPAPPEPEEKKEPKTPEERAAQEAERKRRLAEEVQNKTILGQIGAISTDGGSLVDTLSEGAGRTSMEDAFANSTGVKTNVAGAEKSGLKTSGSSAADGKGSAVGIGSLGGLKGSSKAKAGVKTGNKKEKKIKVRVNLKTPNKMVGGKLDSDSVSKVIRRRQAQIQQCYEREIKKNPKAAGKVIISFTIGTAGRVTKSKAATDSVGGGVGTCVANKIKRFRFPKPSGGEVMVNKTFVFEVAQ